MLDRKALLQTLAQIPNNRKKEVLNLVTKNLLTVSQQDSTNLGGIGNSVSQGMVSHGILDGELSR